jgi:hypothetical protein
MSAYPLHASQIQVGGYRREDELYRSVQNYQVKTLQGFEQVRMAPQPFVQEVRSATHVPVVYHSQPMPYEMFRPGQTVTRIIGAPHPMEVVKSMSAPAEDYEESRSAKKRTQERVRRLEADEDSMIDDFTKKKNSLGEEEAPKEVEQESPTKRKSTNKRQEILSAKKQQQSANQKSPEPKNVQPPQEKALETKNVAQSEEKPKGKAPETYSSPQKQAGPKVQAPEEKSDLVVLPKKANLRNSQHFGYEQRRGGSTFVSDNRLRE